MSSVFTLNTRGNLQRQKITDHHYRSPGLGLDSVSLWISASPAQWKAACLTVLWSPSGNAVLVVNRVWASLSLSGETGWREATEVKLVKGSVGALRSTQIRIKLNHEAWGRTCELLYKLWPTEPSRHIMHTHTRRETGRLIAALITAIETVSLLPSAWVEVME